MPWPWGPLQEWAPCSPRPLLPGDPITSQRSQRGADLCWGHVRAAPRSQGRASGDLSEGTGTGQWWLMAQGLQGHTPKTTTCRGAAPSKAKAPGVRGPRACEGPAPPLLPLTPPAGVLVLGWGPRASSGPRHLAKAPTLKSAAGGKGGQRMTRTGHGDDVTCGTTHGSW